jgi:3-dehydroquinate dehydratase/shikimate dehydrogenase
MGTAGLVSRVCPDRFGSAWTFGGSAAPGQLPIAVLDSVYRIRSQTATTRLFALTGTPLAHSASPAMHNAAFAHLGMDAVYVAIEVNDASDAPAFLALADTLHVEGVSVTAPLKRAWEAAGVALDRRASDIGAANTLMTSGDGSWRATNFDVEGFMAPLRRRRLDLDDARCVVLGAGGAARAAAWALKREKARVEISARRADRAAAMANESGVAVGEWPPQPGWDLLVNATPVGTWPGESDSPIPRASVVGRTVYDLVYHPRRTQLLRWAEEAGIAGIEGLDMLVAQAALQFELWTGRQAPVDVMREAAEAFLEEPGSDETDHL